MNKRQLRKAGPIVTGMPAKKQTAKPKSPKEVPTQKRAKAKSKTKPKANKVGRPSAYDEKAAETICVELAKGRSLREICRGPGMPARSTVYLWIIDDIGGFSDQYARARDVGLDQLADECLEIADDTSHDFVEREGKDGKLVVVPNHELVNRSRLRVDTRKWLLSKLAKKKYGDHHTIAGDEDAPLLREIKIRFVDGPGAPD